MRVVGVTGASPLTHAIADRGRSRGSSPVARNAKAAQIPDLKTEHSALVEAAQRGQNVRTQDDGSNAKNHPSSYRGQNGPAALR